MHRARVPAPLLASVLAAVLLASCVGGASVCRELPLTPEAERALEAAGAQVEFPLARPCAYLSRLEVRRVVVDYLPGDTPQPRVTFVVERRGSRAFLLSETRAVVPFSQIPQGTSRFRVSDGDVVADGFIGPSGSGEEIAYLRWRVAGVTHELAATVQPWQGQREIARVAEALMERAR